VGLGNAGGLLVSGIVIASLSSRLRFFGSTPNAARNVLEDLGLVVSVAIVGPQLGRDLAGVADLRHRDQDGISALRRPTTEPACLKKNDRSQKSFGWIIAPDSGPGNAASNETGSK
jgi:hypothetical protein